MRHRVRRQATRAGDVALRCGFGQDHASLYKLCGEALSSTCEDSFYRVWPRLAVDAPRDQILLSANE